MINTTSLAYVMQIIAQAEHKLNIWLYLANYILNEETWRKPKLKTFN